MIVREKMTDIPGKLERICGELEQIIEDYTENYADYGWDNFTETLANVSAQIYMMAIMARNAQIKGESQNPFR